MVGKFGLGNKGSPCRQLPSSVTSSPPPYQEHGHENPVFATETTTTTTHVVTTTTHTTTTHFFSLPLWIRRGTPALSTTAPKVPRVSSDELGVVQSAANANELMRDKDLPPTPGSTEEHPALGSDRQQCESGGSEVGKQENADIGRSMGSSSLPSILRSSPVLEDSASQPTVALARAALGLGLPHVMPGSVSASSSSTELHAFTLAPPPVPQSAAPRISQSTMRRAKSFHHDPNAPAETIMSHTTIAARRRTRGLSLGPFQFASSDKGKEKQRESESDATHIVPASKPLARKSSFWSRRRVDSHAASSTSHLSVEPVPRPSLPTLQPISPFNVDTAMLTPAPRVAGPSSYNAIDLHRRHSERTPSTSSPKIDRYDVTPHPTHLPMPPSTPRAPLDRRPRRPKTADSASNPRMASFFPDIPQVITSSPPLTEQPLPQHRVPLVQQTSALASQSSPRPRPRSHTNPPLLHRLSISLFGSSSTSNTPYIAPNPLHDPIIGPDTLTSSPSSSYESSRPSFSKRSVEIPRPRAEDESPEFYLHRLTEAVSKAEVATVLASSADPFHARALRAYIARFDFIGDPLDVALRKLLMDVGLPRETQQIDRVIEAFAARYLHCNPDLFVSEDHPYILAFSLIMLHTDAFNKHNKRKMTKSDYVKNTRLPGVAPEVLDCFYDNIVFAPFIFIEDPVDVNGQRGLVPDAINARRMSTFNMPPTPGGSGSTLLGKNNRIDPYYLIARNLLDDLRVNVASVIPMESPYAYQGTGGPWDEDELLRAFTMAGAVEISAENRYAPTPWFGLGVAGGTGPLFPSPGARPFAASQSEFCSIKVTKVGLLLRKDDTLEGGRRAMNRKWREWCVLLTGSQLLFFRDLSWATSIRAQIAPCNGHVVSQITMPQPDEYVSVKDSIAVFDKSYTKHPNTLRLIMPDGRHYLLQAHEEKEMNEWISRVNYASAFKTAGVRMRALGMTNRDIELTGIAAATSHLRDIHRSASTTPPRVRTWHGGLSEEFDTPVTSNSPSPETLSPGSGLARQVSKAPAQDSPMSQIESSSKLFKATFDEVKTELAASGCSSYDTPNTRPNGRPRTQSLKSTQQSPLTSPSSHMSDSSETSRGSSRSEIIRKKLRDLEGRASLAQTQLDTDMRFVRNLAVLTPFQRATRDRVQLAVQGTAKQIMQVRLNLEKLVCYRDVLSDDLMAEERDWARTKKIAMRAATDKLALQSKLTQTRVVPEMTLSVYPNGSEQWVSTSPVSIPHTASTSLSSSFGDESFHSALSSGHWRDMSPDSAAFLDSRGIHDSHSFESPVTSALDVLAGQGREYPFPDVSGRPQASPLVLQSSTESRESSANHAHSGEHEKFYTAPEIQEEQAEEWNKTRAAKRVSLVKLPPDLRIAVLFGKHQPTASEIISEGTATVPSSPERGSQEQHNRRMESLTMLDV